MSTFDVWIIRFEPGDSPPANRLQVAFGIDAKSAQSIEQDLPKIVKHGVHAKAAGEMRLALEAIGAVVECRPARDSKPVKGPKGVETAAVFHPPGADLIPGGRVSAIDPFAPRTEAGVPRISVDEPIPPVPVAEPPTQIEADPARRVTTSLMTKSRQQQRRKFLQRAIGTIIAGVAILAIGWVLGNSVLRGEADWIGIAFDGVGIYLLGVGAYDVVSAVRS
jgi:hypothetical protein